MPIVEVHVEYCPAGHDCDDGVLCEEVCCCDAITAACAAERDRAAQRIRNALFDPAGGITEVAQGALPSNMKPRVKREIINGMHYLAVAAVRGTLPTTR